jgi:hypothetical protein
MTPTRVARTRVTPTRGARSRVARAHGRVGSREGGGNPPLAGRSRANGALTTVGVVNYHLGERAAREWGVNHREGGQPPSRVAGSSEWGVDHPPVGSARPDRSTAARRDPPAGARAWALRSAQGGPRHPPEPPAGHSDPTSNGTFRSAGIGEPFHARSAGRPALMTTSRLGHPSRGGRRTRLTRPLPARAQLSWDGPSVRPTRPRSRTSGDGRRGRRTCSPPCSEPDLGGWPARAPHLLSSLPGAGLRGMAGGGAALALLPARDQTSGNGRSNRCPTPGASALRGRLASRRL